VISVWPLFRIKHVGRGSALGDFDNDGDLDMVIANCGERPLLFRNDGGNRNHWISISARGRESNRFGIGAKVRFTTMAGTQLREINPTGSYLSTGDMRLHIGFGTEPAIAKLEIEWPSGKKQVLENVKPGTRLTLDEANAR
jgi:hypothetical protein